MKLEEQRDRLIPKEEGVKVYLDGKPELTTTEKGNEVLKVVFYNSETDSEFSKMIGDPFNIKADTPKKEKTIRSIIAKQFLNTYHAFMKPEDYDKYKELEHESFAEMIEKANSMLADNWEEVEATIMVGYNKQGYLDIPAFDPFISSEYLNKELVLKPSSGLTLTEPVKDNSVPGMVADSEDEGMIVD